MGRHVLGRSLRVWSLVLVLALGACKASCTRDSKSPPGNLPNRFEDVDVARGHEQRQWERGFAQQPSPPGPTRLPAPIAIGAAGGIVGAGAGAIVLAADSDAGPPPSVHSDSLAPLPAPR